MTVPQTFRAQYPIDHIVKPELRWSLQARAGTGQFVVSPLGTLLFRIDPTARVIYAWDKRAGREIPVRLDELFTASALPRCESALLPLAEAVV